MIIIDKIDETYLKVDGDIGILVQIKEHFSYFIESAKYSPAYKARRWDGKIYLFNITTRSLYLGLYDSLIEFLEKNKIEYSTNYKQIKNNISAEEIINYIKNLKLPYAPRDYQVYGILKAIENKRGLFLSATSSGKSLLQYIITKYLIDKGYKVIIVVPKISLVEQMYSDFEEYGINTNKYIHRIYSGKSGFTKKPIVITTYQSLKNIDERVLESTSVILVDEAHGSTNNTLKNFLIKMNHCEYKMGFTGTLNGEKADAKLIEGLLGKTFKIITPKELIDKGYSPKLTIQVNYLKHQEKKFKDYQEEIKFIHSDNKRNEYIKSLCSSLDGNTLVLFNLIDTHGKVIYENLKSLNREVYFVYGGTEIEDREKIRKLAEEKDNIIICASMGVFSVGVNIKKLHNIIFASSTKSRILGLQSIGRGLRSHESKDRITVFDLVDDYSGGNSDNYNYTLNHFKKRLKYYKEEEFEVKYKKIQLV